MAGVAEVKLVFLVSQPQFMVVQRFDGLDHPQYKVEIGRSQFFGVFSFALLLEEQGHAVAFEVGFREGAQVSQGGQNLAILVIQANLLINRTVVVEFRRATEDSEVGVLSFEGLLGLEGPIEDFCFEVVKEEYVSHFETQGEIFLAVAPEVDLGRLPGRGAVDDLQFLGVVAVGLVLVDAGAVDYQADGAVQGWFFGGGALLLDLLSQLQQV